MDVFAQEERMLRLWWKYSMRSTVQAYTFTDKLSVEVTFYFYLQTSAQVMLNLCQCYRAPLLKFNLLHREQCYKMTVFEYMYVR